MSTAEWPALPLEQWAATCDTLHAHTQLLGKLAARWAPPEPQLQHAALRLTARGWETQPLPAPDGSGAVQVVLDLNAHRNDVEHSDGRRATVALTPHRSVGQVTRDVLASIEAMVGPFGFDLRPQETPWSTPLDEDEEHATYEAAHVAAYFTAATRAAQVLNRVRAPYRGRATPVNAWWGSFDLAISLFSGRPADPGSNERGPADFISRNAMDAQEIAVGWWPGDQRYPKAAFYSYAHPRPAGYELADPGSIGGRWEPTLGEYILDWDDVVASGDPLDRALTFVRSVTRHACQCSDWDSELSASLERNPVT